MHVCLYVCVCYVCVHTADTAWSNRKAGVVDRIACHLGNSVARYLALRELLKPPWLRNENRFKYVPDSSVCQILRSSATYLHCDFSFVVCRRNSCVTRYTPIQQEDTEIDHHFVAKSH